MDEATEREHMRLGVEAITHLTGSRPLGWYTGRDSPNTHRLVADYGGFEYDSDYYGDDLPFWTEVECSDGSRRPHLVVPYTLDANDMRFATPQGFNTATQFYEYLRDSFDALYAEGGRPSIAPERLLRASLLQVMYSIRSERQLVEQRIPDREVLRWIFGAAEDTTLERRLHQLIEWSAGYPRELVRLLRNAILDAPLDDAKLARLLGHAGDDYRRLLLGTDMDWLARVAVEHTPDPADEAQRQAADRMFANNVVLRYQNTEEWYEVHPAVRKLPKLQSAINRLQESDRAANRP